MLFRFPERRDSFLGRLDPRWKLAGLLLATGAAAIVQSLGPSLAALLGAFLLAGAARLPLYWYCVRMAGLTLFLMFFLAWLPFVQPHEGATVTVGLLQLSVPGLVLAAVLLMKTLAVVTLMLILWATAPLPATCKAAYALRVPGLLVHLVVLAYRYVFLLAEEFGRLRIALRVRGFRQRGNLHGLRTVGQVAGTLLVRSQERAERVSQAMRCRGFDGRFRSLSDFRTRARDVLVFFALLVWAGAMLFWDWSALRS